MIRVERGEMPTEILGVWGTYLEAAQREYERSNEAGNSGYPHFTENGSWKLLPVDARSRWTGDVYEHGNWTAGFWFGVMWLLAQGSGNHGPADLARSRLPGLAPRSLDSTTHDLGFLFYPSFVLGQVLGLVGPEEARHAVQAAEMTVLRFNDSGQYIQAFGPVGDSRTAGTSTIDTMMNLPLLWWASAIDGDPDIFTVARRHARTSARLFFRDDGSTYHLNWYDPVSGALKARGTYQGSGDNSCWSRGQAWAICGFAWSYAATGEVEFLEAADRAATHFWQRLPDDGIPPWDFADVSPEAPRDASAAAVAALGALILSARHPVETERRRFADAAVTLLSQLGTSCLNKDGQQDGILLRSCYSKPHGLGVNGAMAWGDFFFGLALGLALERLPLTSVLGFIPVEPGERRIPAPVRPV